jgi:hypothetical protein
MRTIWSKLVFLVLGILSLLGIQPAPSAATPTPTPDPQRTQQINEATSTTPLYLQLGAEMMSRLDKVKDGQMTLAHWAHWAHRAHHAHWAHYAHRAHYSHWNRYWY